MGKPSWATLVALSASVAICASTASHAEDASELERLRAEVSELRGQVDAYRRAETLVQKNLALMRGADESMNARDWDAFRKVHANDVWVTSPDAPKPQEDMDTHLEVVRAFTDAIPDHEIQLPYKAVFGSGEWVCAVHENGGTFSEPWVMPDGSVIEPTGKSFTLTMVTVAKGDGEKLTEERIIYDMSSMARQLGLTAP